MITMTATIGTYKDWTQVEQAREQELALTAATFSTLVEEYSNLAYHVALRMLHNPQDAEDAVQDAFVSAYKALGSFKGQSKLSTWLYRIVVNACLMKIRKNKTRHKYFTDTGYDDAIVYDWDNNPEKTARNGEIRDAIDSALEYLSPELRAAVVLRDVQEFSSEEASEILNISVAALKSRLHRGRIQLRKHLEGVYNDL